jgi:hypothetical protein
MSATVQQLAYDIGHPKTIVDAISIVRNIHTEKINIRLTEQKHTAY